MSKDASFHVVTVGWPQLLIDELCTDIAKQSTARFSHIAHPRHLPSDWTGKRNSGAIRFFRQTRRDSLPTADAQFLASLEREGVPTIHNMIMGDRVVCRLEYAEAQRYATFVAMRLVKLFEEMKPSVVIGGFDSLHGGLALAVARLTGVPWFALHFSVLPPGLACFCDRMSPAARVQLAPGDRRALRALAEAALQQFESRDIKAYAYAPPRPSMARAVARLPARMAALARSILGRRDRQFARFTEVQTRYDPMAALRQLRSLKRANRALGAMDTVSAPPSSPYVLFGLHMQPESSIDVWAPFFSNQLWVIELLARSIPPSHKLLVKIHKSDVSNHSKQMLDRMQSFPGVELVRPSADSRTFIENADLVVAIQGTMGLEAALLGRPVIMLGDSPVTVFPSALRASTPDEVPTLVRSQLARPRLRREEIVDAYASYLAPFMPASHNDWRSRKNAAEVEGFVRLFDALRTHLDGTSSASAESGT